MAWKPLAWKTLAWKTLAWKTLAWKTPVVILVDGKIPRAIARSRRTSGRSWTIGAFGIGGRADANPAVPRKACNTDAHSGSVFAAIRRWHHSNVGQIPHSNPRNSRLSNWPLECIDNRQ